MIAALLFLQFNSIKNRLVTRVLRMRKPKYLFGAIVGGAYFYFYFGRHFFGARQGGNLANVFPQVDFPLEMLGAFALFVIILAAWLFPHQRAALAFTEAEVAFLFPAPISRRTLIHFKLLKSQTGILVSILFLTLISRRFSGANGLIHAAGWWLILSTLNLHFLGSSFARTLLLERGISNWARRTVVLLVVALSVLVTVIWAKDTLPMFTLSQTTDLTDIAHYLEQFLQSGPLPYLLLPFQIMVQPFLASDARSFFTAAAPALLLLALHYWWVVRSNVAFEEASVEMSQRIAEKITAVRSGNWQAAAAKPNKKRRSPFLLQPLGVKPVALLWKNLISAGQMFSVRLWIFVACFAVFGSFSFGGVGARSGIFVALGFLSMMLLVMSLIGGPQMMRQDFRQDLPAIDVLKTYPLPGWQIVLGELLAPVLILTAVQWVLLILAFGFSANMSTKGFPIEMRFAVAFGLAVIIPTLNLISLLIPNAAVLLFPSWFQTGKDAPTGIEAMGQRMIFLFGQILVLTIALAPGAAIFGVIVIVGKMFLGLTAAIPLASTAAALILAIEGFIGVKLLGKIFERFDLSAETTN